MLMAMNIASCKGQHDKAKGQIKANLFVPTTSEFNVLLGLVFQQCLFKLVPYQ